MLLAPATLWAQGELTLEGVAEAVSTLTVQVHEIVYRQNGQDAQLEAMEERLAAIETAIAPTPTPEATPAATPIPAPHTVLVVTTVRGNVRAGPGTHHAIVGSVSKGETLEGPYQEKGGWYQFCCTDGGERAWIWGALVSVKQTADPTAWEEARSAAVEIDRDDLIRNNELHIGKLVYFDDALVVQTLEDGMIVNRTLADGIGETLILSYQHEPLRIIQGDTIEFVAEVVGVYTYEIISLGMITSPVLEVVAMRLVE